MFFTSTRPLSSSTIEPIASCPAVSSSTLSWYCCNAMRA